MAQTDNTPKQNGSILSRLFPLLAILFLLAALYLFNQNGALKEENNKLKAEIEELKENGKPIDTLTEKDIADLKENHIIPVEESDSLRRDYITNRYQILKPLLQEKYGKNFEETKSLWTDFKSLENYLKYIKKRIGGAPDGLMFYMSVYPNNKAKYGEDRNHLTFFIRPTKKDGDIQKGFGLDEKGQIDFIEYSDDNSIIQQQTPNKAGFFSFNTTILTSESLDYNRTKPIPPNDPETVQ